VVSGVAEVESGPFRFVVQLHAARQLHYDFRLEIGGALVSWAVPKGPSLRPADKRLATRVDDHALLYGDFEGILPVGSYGAGRVIVWDNGSYAPVPEPKGSPPVLEREAAARLIEQQLAEGQVKVELYGHKMRGRWALVYTKGRMGPNGWLLIKDRDAHSREESGPPGDDRSVLSGRTLNELTP
jgi:bifunctional non-homologous end joining protein LigD